jgi:hypothetical protein
MIIMREIGHIIGRITLLQVQRSVLAVRKRLGGYYDPAPLVVVESLQVSPAGVVGIAAGGSQVMDIHHMQHPDSHNVKGINGISLGFTSHYQSMREKLGNHLVDGIAGENILVEADAILTLADLGERLAIQNQHTGQLLYLSGLQVAAPCVEFSQFAANHGMPLPAQQLKETLQFLDDGRRGFYARMEDQPELMTIQAGDQVFTYG